MARKPNYQFERMERERSKARLTAEKSDAKRERRARERGDVAPDLGEGAGQPADES